MGNRHAATVGSAASDAVGELNLEALNAEFANRHALDILEWAKDRFGEGLAVSSSFGADSAVMLSLAVQIKPDISVITVDTGFLFEQTLQFRETLRERLGLNLAVFRPAVDHLVTPRCSRSCADWPPRDTPAIDQRWHSHTSGARRPEYQIGV